MILGSWSDFRRYFSREVEETASFSFVNGTSRLERAAGSFLSMPKTNGGAAAAMQSDSVIEVTGTVSNDAIYTATNITATYVELAEAPVTEGPVTCTVRAVPRDLDHTPEWPLIDMRALGFDGGLTGMPSPFTAAVASLTANSTAADATAGADEYHWYLSQRTDDPTKQFWALKQFTGSSSLTFSGAVVLTPTTLFTNLYDVAVDNEELAPALKYVHLYCVRVLDGAIQWLDLYRAAQGAT
jgi:hypothetical protein